MTHRLLAQHVKLVAIEGDLCRVQFDDGSIGTVHPREMVTVAAVHDDQRDLCCGAPEACTLMGRYCWRRSPKHASAMVFAVTAVATPKPEGIPQ